jgi:acyl-CoA thioester hydrolase
MTALPFRYLMRVRYGECDAQGIVFNARWGEYVDTAVSEFGRAVFGHVDAAVTGLDWRLVKQTTTWHAPAKFDDVLDIRVHALRLGTTSFTLATELHRFAGGAHLASVETIYVMVTAAGEKRAVPDAARAALERGAPGAIVDHAAALAR